MLPYLSFTQFSLEISTGATISKSINVEENFRNLSYEVRPVFDFIDFGVDLEYRKNKKNIALGVGFTSLGFTKKSTQGFTPTPVVPISGNDPVHFFNYHHYYNLYLALSGGWNLSEVLELEASLDLFHLTPSLVNFDRDIFVLDGQSADPYAKYFDVPSTNFRPLSLASRWGFKYQLFKKGFLQVKYIIGLTPFTEQRRTIQMYHNGVSVRFGYQIGLGGK